MHVKPVTIYSTRVCPYCMRAKALLDSKHIPYTEFLVDADPARREEMLQKSGRRTVPQIFIGERPRGWLQRTLPAGQPRRPRTLLAD